MLWFGSLFSFLAFMMSNTAQNVVAFDIAGNNRAVGLVMFGQGIAMLVLSPFGGALADRMSKRLLLLVAQSAIGLTMIVTAILIVAEVFTSGFVLLWFGIGALAAALASIVGIDSIAIQFLIFAAVSVGLTVSSRTIFVNYFSKERTGQSLRTGVDALPGKIGTVVSSSKGALNEGAVKVFGSTWTA